MQNLGSFRPLGAILGAPSHTELDFAIPRFQQSTMSFYEPIQFPSEYKGPL